MHENVTVWPKLPGFVSENHCIHSRSTFQLSNLNMNLTSSCTNRSKATTRVLPAHWAQLKKIQLCKCFRSLILNYVIVPRFHALQLLLRANLLNHALAHVPKQWKLDSSLPMQSVLGFVLETDRKTLTVLAITTCIALRVRLLVANVHAGN